jgi:hypothetical protein
MASSRSTDMCNLNLSFHFLHNKQTRAEIYDCFVRFEVLAAVTKKSMVLWALNAVSSETARRFGKNTSAGFLLGLFFDLGGDMFLRNVGLSPNYATIQRRSPRFYDCFIFRCCFAFANNLFAAAGSERNCNK